MSTLTSAIDEMITPRFLGGFAAKSGLPSSTVKNGITGAIGSIVEGLAGKAHDPKAMSQAADLIAKAPDDVDAEQLLDDEAPIQKSGNQLLGMLSSDTPSMASRLSKSLGVGGAAATGLLGAGASLAMSAFHKIGRSMGGLDASTLASTLLGERRAAPAMATSTVAQTPRTVEYVERKSRAWWWIPLIALAALGLWMWNRGRTRPEVTTPIVNPQLHTTRPKMESNVTPSAPMQREQPTVPAAPKLMFTPGTAEAGVLAAITTPTGADNATWFGLDNVQFDTGEATIRTGSEEQLAHVAQILKANPTAKIEVGGFTDATGTPDTNAALSQARADAVRQALIADGADGNQIQAKGYAEQNKVEETQGSAQANRRVAIRLLSR